MTVWFFSFLFPCISEHCKENKQAKGFAGFKGSRKNWETSLERAGWGGMSRQQCGLTALGSFVSFLKQKLHSLAMECWLPRAQRALPACHPCWLSHEMVWDGPFCLTSFLVDTGLTKKKKIWLTHATLFYFLWTLSDFLLGAYLIIFFLVKCA